MVHVISWNVAGLSTTVARIHESYQDEVCKNGNHTKGKGNGNGNGNGGTPYSAFEYYLDRLGADIICFQEHKIPYTQLSNRSEPYQCASLQKYESYWSKTTSSGMNGVVTYVKKKQTYNTTTTITKTSTSTGVVVIKANATPLQDQELDDQGRCIMTDHGSFCVFNVYVPCSGGHALGMKMKFLQALRRAMQQCGKPVILAGDYNITHTGRDVYWKDRVVVVDELQKSQRQQTSQSPEEHNEEWKEQVQQKWPFISSILENHTEVVPVQTTNPTTGQTFQKYRLCCTIPHDQHTRKVFLGKHESKPDYCTHAYNIKESWYTCPETGNQILSRKANTVSISVLTELMAKIGGIVWDETTQRNISNSILHTGVCQYSPTRQWLSTLMKEDDMVDTFRELYPTALGRFTCWNQNTNRRYDNEGARIDYILVSRALSIQKPKEEDEKIDATVNADTTTTGTTLSSRARTRRTHLVGDDLLEAAALADATAHGAYQPVSFLGGGIASVSRDVLDLQFVPTPHTGMIYTPPSFSDHIAISAVLQDIPESESVLSRSQVVLSSPAVATAAVTCQIDKETRQTQPHKTQRSIASFLTTASAADNKKRASNHLTTTTISSSTKKMTTIQSKKKKSLKPNSILNHFGIKK